MEERDAHDRTPLGAPLVRSTDRSPAGPTANSNTVWTAAICACCGDETLLPETLVGNHQSEYPRCDYCRRHCSRPLAFSQRGHQLTDEQRRDLRQLRERRRAR